jgi:hypothetical protein
MVLLGLVARRRLKAHGGFLPPIALGAQPPHPQLDHLMVAGIALRLQLLEDPVDV